MSRAWSIGKTDRFKIDQFQKKNRELQNVAPGTYQSSLADKKAEPRWSMAAKLQQQDKRVSASPDRYDIPSKIVESPGKTMGARFGGVIQSAARLAVPGPGQYAADKQKAENYSFSMGGRLREHKGLAVPGPGAYDGNAEAVMTAAKQARFGTGQRSQMAIPGVKINPGPGAHSPDYRALKTAAPGFGFGTETRADGTGKQKQMPGPGTYALPQMIGNDGPSKTLHATLSYSPEAKEAAKKPGPGAYDGDVLRTRKQDPQYKVGTSQRLDLAAAKKAGAQPAPGSYNPSTAYTQTASQRWGFGTEKRLRRSEVGGAPGAGTYTLPSKLQDGPSYGMGMRLERGASTNLKNPGPGQYELQDKDNMNMRGGLKYGIGTSKRPSLVARSISTVPAPGTYESSLADKTRNPIFGFGTGQRGSGGKSQATIPGPGTYALKGPTGTEGRASSIHGKLAYKPIEKSGGLTPGPGAYESHTKNKTKDPAWGTGTSKRAAEVNKHIAANPGPGGYSPTPAAVLKADPKFGFGSEQRKGPVDAKTAFTPGPGNYALDPMAINPGKGKFYMGQRLPAMKETTAVPGAGSYNPSPEKTKGQLPAYSMKIKLASDLGRDNRLPGPGAYDANLNDKKAAAKFGFGTSTRDNVSPKKQNISPGPGAYKINVKVGEVPGYAMPNRPDEFKYV